MKRYLPFLALGLLAAGCSGDKQTELDTAAPPPSSDAVAPPTNPNKQIPTPPSMGGGPGPTTKGG